MFARARARARAALEECVYVTQAAHAHMNVSTWKCTMNTHYKTHCKHHTMKHTIKIALKTHYKKHTTQIRISKHAIMHAADAPPAAFRIPEKLYVEGFSLIMATNERLITTNRPPKILCSRARARARRWKNVCMCSRPHTLI